MRVRANCAPKNCGAEELRRIAPRRTDAPRHRQRVRVALGLLVLGHRHLHLAAVVALHLVVRHPVGAHVALVDRLAHQVGVRRVRDGRAVDRHLHLALVVARLRLVARDAADGEPAAGAAGRARRRRHERAPRQAAPLAGVLDDGVDAPRVRREGDARARVDQPEVGARAERRAVEARAAAVDEHAQVAVVEELVVVRFRVPLVSAFADLVAWVEVEAAVGRSRGVEDRREHR